MTSILKRHIVALSLGLLTTLAAHSSQADISYYVNQSGGGDFDGRDIDFTSVQVPINTSGVNAVGLKMRNIELLSNNNQSVCLEIRTSGDGTGDTRLWYTDANGEYQSLNDDSNGTLYSMARVWITPPSTTYQYAFLFVTGYSAAYNSMKFSLDIWKLPSTTTEAQCTQGATYKIIRGTVTVTGQS